MHSSSWRCKSCRKLITANEVKRNPGIQLGAALMQDAVMRATGLAQNAGVWALLVHALHERAQPFYEHYGLQASLQHPLILPLRLGAAKP